VCDSSGGLLLAEALDRLNGRHFVRMCDEEVCRKVVRAGVVGRLVVVRFEMRLRPVISFRRPHFVRQACASAGPASFHILDLLVAAATHRQLLCDDNNDSIIIFLQLKICSHGRLLRSVEHAKFCSNSRISVQTRTRAEESVAINASVARDHMNKLWHL